MKKDSSSESRRKFMRQSFRRFARMGFELTGSDMTPDAPRRQKIAQPTPPPKVAESFAPNQNPEMAYAKLGRTGLMASRIVLDCGGARMGNVHEVERALDLGVNLLSTAHNFGDSELALGSIMPSLREKAWICVKMLPCYTEAGTATAQFDGDVVMAFWDCLDSSLARLKTDRIDCFMVQAIDEAWRAGDTNLHEAIDRAREQGKIRSAGISTYRQVDAVIDAAIASDMFDVIETPINLANLHRVAPVLGRASRAGLGIIAASPFVGVDDERELPLYELPDYFRAHDLALMHIFRTTAAAGCLIAPKDQRELERYASAALFDPTIVEMTELDGVVDEELGPICCACRSRRSPVPEALEAAYAADAGRHDTWGLAKAYPSDWEGEAGLLICRDCLDESEAAADEAAAAEEGPE